MPFLLLSQPELLIRWLAMVLVQAKWTRWNNREFFSLFDNNMVAEQAILVHIYLSQDSASEDLHELAMLVASGKS